VGHPDTQEQARTREPTDQNRNYGSVQIGHGDWCGDHEPKNPSDGRAAPILGQEPLELGQTSDRRRDAEDASDNGSGKEPRLPCCVPKDGTDDGTQACQRPSDEERAEGLQENGLAPDVACSPNGSRLSCGAE
jgi:hypothetical protein